jgi:competence protein ComEA
MIMKFRRLVAVTLALAMALLVSTGAAVAAGKPAPTGKVNINSATAEQLVVLPGVGPKLAARIVEHRQKAGSFKTVQELMNVRGIGEKNFEKIQGYLTVGGDSSRSASAK